MKNPIKIAKYTFWITFIIGILFILGVLIGKPFQIDVLGILSLLCGYIYFYVAIFINFIVLISLLIDGIFASENRKQCFIGISILLINAPLICFYAYFYFLHIQ